MLSRLIGPNAEAQGAGLMPVRFSWGFTAHDAARRREGSAMDDKTGTQQRLDTLLRDFEALRHRLIGYPSNRTSTTRLYCPS